jgi:flagellar motor switch protein FliN
MSDMSEAPNFGSRTTNEVPRDQNFELLSGVAIRVSVEVGSASVRLADLLSLAEGSVVELDRAANDFLDIFANGTLIAKGEIVDVDGRYGIRIVDVIAPERRAAGFERRA